MPTNGMTIDGLNTVSSLTVQDEVPVWDKEASGEPTRKITAQNLTNSLKTLGSLVNTTEMNNAIAQSTAVTQVSTGISNVDGYKAGNIVMLKLINVNYSASSYGWYTIGTLPTTLRPYVECYFVVYDNNVIQYSESSVLPCHILANGNVDIFVFPDRLSVKAMGTMTYLAA